MSESEGVRGYKVFNPDWTCRNKQYTCPGKFEEDVEFYMCEKGMHFCKNAADCFNYYAFNIRNKVAEVIAYGDVSEVGDKCVTNRLEIVREIPWAELLEIVNTGKGCIGLNNTGYYNIGTDNSGNRNVGYHNSGDDNTGSRNSGNKNTGNDNSGKQNTGWNNMGNGNAGFYNTGNYNTGNNNSSDWNSGDHNGGKRNTGDWNVGNRNSGDDNAGDRNTGDYNIGVRNSGSYNRGYGNTGSWNVGNWNTGDCNKTNFSNGCFNTEESKMFFFNEPSNWTFHDWHGSKAREIICRIEFNFKWVCASDMTDEEKSAHPDYNVVGGYLKRIEDKEAYWKWWNDLSDSERNIIKSIPNFNVDIFKEITGIEVFIN